MFTHLKVGQKYTSLLGTYANFVLHLFCLQIAKIVIKP